MNIKSKYFNLSGFIVALIIILAGCYPKGPEFIQDYGIVVTDYDPDFDFGSKKTYYMPDTIGFETNIGDDNIEEVIRQYEELILGLIEDNMSARNYQRIDTSAAEQPDLVIGVTALALENSGVGWVPSPCWSWWCWYYPPYWYPVGYSYSTGTVLIQMGDPEDFLNFNEDIEANVAWLGALDGLLSSSTSTNVQGVTNGINQAFTQSPYIQSNQ
jgi:hypothetical protein